MTTALVRACIALATCAVCAGAFKDVNAQSTSAQIPTVSLTGHGYYWDGLTYADGRKWAFRDGPEDEVLVTYPIYLKNCWLPGRGKETFPITHFQIPIQFDSSILEFVEVEPRGQASNFTFDAVLSADTSYMSVVNRSNMFGQQGVRVTVRATVTEDGDSLRDPFPIPTDNLDCSHFFYFKLFHVVFRIKAVQVPSNEELRTALVITNDSLTFNDYGVDDEIWWFPDDPWREFRGLDGFDNSEEDSTGAVTYLDSLRPSKPAMIWTEIVDTLPGLDVSIGDTTDVDTVVISVPHDHTWQDTTRGIGWLSVIVSNPVPNTRIGPLEVATRSDHILFDLSFVGLDSLNDPGHDLVDTSYIRTLDNGTRQGRGRIDARGLPAFETGPARLSIFKVPERGSEPETNYTRVETIQIRDYLTGELVRELVVVLNIWDSTSTSVNEESMPDNAMLNVFPNPNSGSTTFTVNVRGSATLEVASITGERIETIQLGEAGEVSHSNIRRSYPTGTYFATLRSPTGVVTKKVVVVR